MPLQYDPLVIEYAAKTAFEAMRERVCPGLKHEPIHGWDRQPDSTRDDWRAAIRAAILTLPRRLRGGVE